MDITWYGLSCFRIREGGVTVICDPYDKSVSGAAPKLRADIVTTSHLRPGHSAIERVTGEVKVLAGPGNKRHGLINRPQKMKRQGRGSQTLTHADGLTVKQWAPYGLG